MKTNNQSSLLARILCAVLLMGSLLNPSAALADPRADMGGGNFTNGDIGSETTSQHNALITLGAKQCRMNLYPDNYWNGTTATPATQDAAILQAKQKGITPMILFEYYGVFNNLGGYNKWFAIGRDFATRFRPNSPWLISQGITDWGISIYSAINEPESQNSIPKTGANSYYSALEGLADGVHSINSTLKVNPGGFMAENAGSDHTLKGYGTAIAPLWNNGKLDGMDLHTYNDIFYAPIIDRNGNGNFDFSPQSDFDSVKSTCGITRDINFYATEFGFKNDPSQAIDENLAAKRFLTCIWANLGVVKNNGSTRATVFAFPWNIFSTAASDETYGLCTQLEPWTPRARGQTLRMVLNTTEGLNFTSLSPKGRGEYILAGGAKKMWVWQNYPNWSSIAGTSYTVTGIPAGSSKLEVFGWDGLRQTITLSGQTSYTLSGLPGRETYMFVSHAGLGNNTYKIIARHSGKALDAAGMANGANVLQWEYLGGGNQKWTITNLGSGQYKIIGLQSGRALDVGGASNADGGNVLIWDYVGSNNQKWNITATSGGYYKVTAVHSGKALDVSGGSTVNGANVYQWGFVGGTNQEWAFQIP